jgi:hypothetical protein
MKPSATLGLAAVAALSFAGTAAARPIMPSCIAKCPDGYQYRTCTEAGAPILYFADPCMMHRSSTSSSKSVSSSASSVSSKSSSSGGACAPSGILCSFGAKPQCIASRWFCLPVSR